MLELFGHPFSSYCQKVLIALREKDLGFELKLLAPEQAENGLEFARLWPIRRMPLLRAGEQVLMESTIIIEWLDQLHPQRAPMLPADPQRALRARMLDRLCDQYLMTPMQKLVFDCIRPEEQRDAFGCMEARSLLELSYAWFDAELPKDEWAAGKDFSLADCAAAPALFYADWVHPIAERFERLRDYRRRLLARPSVKHAVDDARPYRPLFPPGAPDRD